MKMKHFIIIYAYFLFLICCCARQDIQDIQVIQIDPELSVQGTLMLSEVVESIEYILLETNERCLIGTIRRSQDIKVSNNYILVYCSNTQKCYLFNRSGTFIGKIGDRGNGPGEYMNVSLFAIDEENGHIILSTRAGRETGQLFYYSLEGTYLHTISVDHRLCGPICAQFNTQYVAMHLNDPFKEGEPPFNYSIFSQNYELLVQKVKNIDFVSTIRGVGTYPGDYWYYLYVGELHVKNAILNDTLFRISKNLDFVPKYIIDSGKYAFSSQILSDPTLYQKEFHSRIFLCSIFETKSSVLLSYIYNNDIYYQSYNKRDGKSILFDSGKDISGDFFGVNVASGIPNDFDGGLDFWPKQQNGYLLVTWYNASLFEENSNKRIPKGTQRDQDQLTKVTTEVMNYHTNTHTEANPVVVIAKMKQ